MKKTVTMRSVLFTAAILVEPATTTSTTCIGFINSLTFHHHSRALSSNLALPTTTSTSKMTPPPPPPPTTTTTTVKMMRKMMTTTRLFATSSSTTNPPEPLASEGDWSAYLDSESTGYIYYFNGVTGESTWEKPTSTFPSVTPTSTTTTMTKEDRRAERQRKREERKKDMETRSNVGGGGLFSGLFGGNSNAKTKNMSQQQRQQQLSDLRSMTQNKDEFLTELDAVIAEAEEAISIADKVSTAPVKNKGGFFSSLGFISGMEAVEEVETLISDVEERTSKAFEDIFSGFAKKSDSKSSSTTITTSSSSSSSSSTSIEEENIWVEGLKNLFVNAFDSFIPPPLTTTSTGKKIAVNDNTSSTSSSSTSTMATATPKIGSLPSPTKKAEVSDSDFLDVIWGAETSARPTLNIAEMMKAFKIRSTMEESSSTAAVGAVEEEVKTLTLEAALQIRPHPEKISWGGEDAGFIIGRTFGIFDGVSGATKESGKKLYSKSLADSMKKYASSSSSSSITSSRSSSTKDGLTVKQITEYLTTAKEFADDEATGASTAVIASIGSDNILRALNLGDSVCLVLRDGAVAARTREIIHYFDCPYQLGDDSPDRPGDGTTLQAELYKGDIIVAGSDGVFDNLSDADVCGIVTSLGPRSKSSVIAKTIVDKSRAVSLDPMSVTPYSTVARGKSGYSAYKNGRGGKVDDISCIVVKAS